MSRLALTFLGTFQASLADQPITHFRSSNVQGLLVFLAMQPGRAVTRDVLATLFWPDEPDDRARANLRQSLYQLRKLLQDDDGSFLTVTRQTVRLNPDSNYRCDVHDFTQAIELGDLAAAVSCYHGELLPGFNCDSLEFEDWLRQERERLHGLVLTALDRLAARYLRNGRVADAQDIARRHLGLEPWSETAHRQLIEALALAGHRSAALAQVEQCRMILARELGVTLSEETIALAERIERGTLQPVDPRLIAGRYILGEEIARGAVGIVYHGRESRTGAPVAIKMLDPAAVDRQPELVSRFLQEGEALQQLNHPNIVKILATDKKDGRHFLVMEYVSGGDLGEMLARDSPLSLHQSLSIALDIADALTRAHRLNILHRDIKPGNVLLDREGLPRLADFGLARLGPASLFISHDGVVGTVAYLSPEACLGEALDARSDIWSFGVLLHEMLLGDRPFFGHTAAATMNQILHAPVPDVTAVRPDLPVALADLLYRMLTKSKMDRIPSVRLVGAELEAILQVTGQDSHADRASRHPGGLPAGRPAFATPTPAHVARIAHNLPAQSAPFVGREAELAELERLLSDPSVRLVTILGAGGMGKTRLSLEGARRVAELTASTAGLFPDGVFFVELAAIDSAAQMFPAIATALGFALQRELDPLQQILNYVLNRRALLLLDNFEQLLATPSEGTKAVTALLRGAPALRILVTSRQKLNLNGETILNIEGLSFPESQSPAGALGYSAVRLFVQSARRARADFELTEKSLHHVAEICSLVDGMPLGILLAAAWIDLLSLPEVVTEMRADIDFLQNDMGDLPPRQRSMRAVFDYSWTLLSQDEKDVLAKLSVFQGSFSREAAQAVTDASLRQLLALVNKSLVQRNVENGRFALHELLRQLAAEKLERRGSTVAVRNAHSRFYLQRLEDYAPSRLAFVALAPDTQNLKTAWLWGAKQGDAARLIATVESLHVYFNVVGREFELFVLWLEALSLLPPGDPTSRNVADDVTAVRASILNRLQESGHGKDHHDEPIDIDALVTFFRARGATLDEAIACQHLAYRAIEQGDFEQALFFFQSQARLYEEVKATFRLASSLAITATMAFRAGQAEVGLALAERSLAVSEQYGDELIRLAPLIAMAFYTLHDQIDYKTADRQYSEVSTLGHDLWRQGLTANPAMIGLAWQGFIALLQGDLFRARQFAQELQAISEVRNNPREKGSAACFLGLLEATSGNYQLTDPSIFETVAIGHTDFAVYNLILNACGLGNVEAATTGIMREWSQPMAMRWPSVLLRTLPAAAFVLAEKGDYVRATALMAMGRGHPACPSGWWQLMVLVHEVDARLQKALLPEDYAAAIASGQALDFSATAVALLSDLQAMAALVE